MPSDAATAIIHGEEAPSSDIEVGRRNAGSARIHEEEAASSEPEAGGEADAATARRRRRHTPTFSPADACNLLLCVLVSFFTYVFVWAWVSAISEADYRAVGIVTVLVIATTLCAISNRGRLLTVLMGANARGDAPSGRSAGAGSDGTSLGGAAFGGHGGGEQDRLEMLFAEITALDFELLLHSGEKAVPRAVQDSYEYYCYDGGGGAGESSGGSCNDSGGGRNDGSCGGGGGGGESNSAEGGCRDGAAVRGAAVPHGRPAAVSALEAVATCTPAAACDPLTAAAATAAAPSAEAAGTGAATADSATWAAAVTGAAAASAVAIATPATTPAAVPTCRICLDAFRTGERLCRLPCAHDYHADCIRVWLDRRHLCPLCRLDLLAYAGMDADDSLAATAAAAAVVAPPLPLPSPPPPLLPRRPVAAVPPWRPRARSLDAGVSSRNRFGGGIDGGGGGGGVGGDDGGDNVGGGNGVAAAAGNAGFENDGSSGGDGSVGNLGEPPRGPPAGAARVGVSVRPTPFAGWFQVPRY